VRWLGLALAFPFVGVGWLAGAVVRLVRLGWAAIREGYAMGVNRD